MRKYLIIRKSDLSLLGFYFAIAPAQLAYSYPIEQIQISESLNDTRLYAFKENDEIKIAELPEEAPIEPTENP